MSVIEDRDNSITNRCAYVRSYVNKDKALRKMNVLKFVDDGYTGKNMTRPDMQRMLDLVKKKQIKLCYCEGFFQIFQRPY
ncbi:MAG: recombinase family protein [Lachnospira eligens]